jgi:hypothetical protein
MNPYRQRGGTMIDFFLAGLSAGLFAFLALFILSFATLGMVTASMHLLMAVNRALFGDKPRDYQDQAV